MTWIHSKGDKGEYTCEDILIFPESTPTLADISITDRPVGPAAAKELLGYEEASKKR